MHKSASEKYIFQNAILQNICKAIFTSCPNKKNVALDGLNLYPIVKRFMIGCRWRNGILSILCRYTALKILRDLIENSSRFAQIYLLMR